MASGWWLVAGGWWLVIGGWQLVAGGCGPQHPTHRHKHIDYSRRRRTQIFCTRDTGYKVFGQFGGLPPQFSKSTRWEDFFIFRYNKA